jgi:hypothetical protein
MLGYDDLKEVANQKRKIAKLMRKTFDKMEEYSSIRKMLYYDESDCPENEEVLRICELLYNGVHL